MLLQDVDAECTDVEYRGFDDGDRQSPQESVAVTGSGNCGFGNEMRNTSVFTEERRKLENLFDIPG